MKEVILPEPLLAPEHLMGSMWLIPEGETYTTADGRILIGRMVVRVAEYADGSKMLQANNDLYQINATDFQEEILDAPGE